MNQRQKEIAAEFDQAVEDEKSRDCNDVADFLKRVLWGAPFSPCVSAPGKQGLHIMQKRVARAIEKQICQCRIIYDDQPDHCEECGKVKVRNWNGRCV